MVPSIVNRLTMLTSDQIAAQYVQHGDVELWEGKNSHNLEKHIPNIGNHFGLKWVDFFKEGEDRTKLVIVPISNDGKKIYFCGQINTAIQAGLSKDWAFKWALCRNRHKYALLPLIVEIFSDSRLLKAYFSYDEKNRDKWKEKYNIFPFECSLKEEAHLADIVHFMITTK